MKSINTLPMFFALEDLEIFMMFWLTVKILEEYKVYFREDTLNADTFCSNIPLLWHSYIEALFYLDN